MQLVFYNSNLKKDSAIHLAVVDCLLSIIILPYELRSTQPAKCKSTGLIFSLCGFSFSFFFQGKAGSPGERGPPGKPVSIVYHGNISLLKCSFMALISGPLFFFLSTLSKKTSLCPVQTTQTCKLSSHPLLNVIYIIIALGVCQ